MALSIRPTMMFGVPISGRHPNSLGVVLQSSCVFYLLGDIVGKPGRDIVCAAVERLVAAHNLDLVIANAENAAFFNLASTTSGYISEAWPTWR